MKKQVLAIVASTIVLVGVIVILVSQTKNTANVDSLHIKEWSVRLPLNATIADAYYSYDSARDEAYISTRRLDSLVMRVSDCTAGLHGFYYKKTSDAPLKLTQQGRVEPACIAKATAVTEEIGVIQDALQNASQAATQ